MNYELCTQNLYCINMRNKQGILRDFIQYIYMYNVGLCIFFSTIFLFPVISECVLKIDHANANVRAPVFLKQENNVQCTYQITTPVSQSKLALTLSNLQLGKSHLMVYDGLNKSDPVIFNSTACKSIWLVTYSASPPVSYNVCEEVTILCQLTIDLQ